MALGHLVTLALILALGMGATWLAWRFDVPSILLLLFAGILAGPVTGWLDPDAAFGELLLPLVSLSVGIILFEGGLSLRLVELEEIGSAVRNLITVGVLATWAITTAAALWILELSLSISLLLGAVLVVTGPTVVLPLLRHLRPRGTVGTTLKWEGILIDPIGVVLAVVVFEGLLAGGFQAITKVLVVTIGNALLAGTVFGVLGAMLTYQLLKRHWVPDHLDSPVTLGLVVVVFTACEWVQSEAGLVGATVMGMVMANHRDIAKRHIVEFKENLRVLLIGFLFVVLAARLPRSAIDVLGWRSLAFLGVLVLVARPLAVFLSTLGTDTPRRERVFLASMAPRGIVAAAISSVFAIELAHEGIPGAEQLVPITFLVIIGTVALYGLGAGPIARWLGIGDPDPQGALIVGAHPWARDLGSHLKAAGLPVRLVDTNRRHLRRARAEGLDTYEGSLFSENALEEIQLGGIGHLLALTPNDEVNALTAINLRELFDRAHTFQLSPRVTAEEEAVPQPDLHGRFLFDEEATYETVEERISEDGWSMVTTQVPAGEGPIDPTGPDRLPLAVVDSDGGLSMFTHGQEPPVRAGDRLIQLLEPGATDLPPQGRDEDQ